MAYLSRGYTPSELRARWQNEAVKLGADQLLALFGQPPYYFLGETPISAPTNDTPTYAQQKRPLLVDEQGRQYTPVGSDDPTTAHIRLSTGITRQQRSVQSRVPTNQLQAFPRIGETLHLRPSGSSVGDSAKQWTVRVKGLENVRTASASVLFHQALPDRNEIETTAVAARRDRALQQRLESTATAAATSGDTALAEGRALRRFLAMDVSPLAVGGGNASRKRSATHAFE
jgi:hypothetical protein